MNPELRDTPAGIDTDADAAFWEWLFWNDPARFIPAGRVEVVSDDDRAAVVWLDDMAEFVR